VHGAVFSCWIFLHKSLFHNESNRPQGAERKNNPAQSYSGRWRGVFSCHPLYSHNGMTGSDSQAWVMLRSEDKHYSHKRKEPVDEEK
jgi:hypothetical protein